LEISALFQLESNWQLIGNFKTNSSSIITQLHNNLEITWKFPTNNFQLDGRRGGQLLSYNHFCSSYHISSLSFHPKINSCLQSNFIIKILSTAQDTCLDGAKYDSKELFGTTSCRSLLEKDTKATLITVKHCSNTVADFDYFCRYR